jgi:hypothetical protein
VDTPAKPQVLGVRTAELSRLPTLFPRSFWNFIRLIAFSMSQVRFDVRPLLRPPRSWCRPALRSIEILLFEQSAQVTRLNAYQFLLHNEHTITASRSTSFVLLRSSANSSLDCGSILKPEVIWIRSASRSYPRLLREPQTRNIAMPASLEQDANHPRKFFADMQRLQFLQNRFSPL